MREALRMATGLALVLGTLAVMPTVSAVAHERLLRCVTSPVSLQPGHKRQHFSQHRFYAPVHSAMYFSRAGSACRWKAAHRRRG